MVYMPCKVLQPEKRINYIKVSCDDDHVCMIVFAYCPLATESRKVHWNPWYETVVPQLVPPKQHSNGPRRSLSTVLVWRWGLVLVINRGPQLGTKKHVFVGEFVVNIMYKWNIYMTLEWCLLHNHPIIGQSPTYIAYRRITCVLSQHTCVSLPDCTRDMCMRVR